MMFNQSIIKTDVVMRSVRIHNHRDDCFHKVDVHMAADINRGTNNVIYINMQVYYINYVNYI